MTQIPTHAMPEPPEPEREPTPQIDTEAMSESIAEALRQAVEQATEQVIQALRTQPEVSGEEDPGRREEGSPASADERDNGQSDMSGQLDKVSQGLDRVVGLLEQQLNLLRGWEA